MLKPTFKNHSIREKIFQRLVLASMLLSIPMSKRKFENDLKSSMKGFLGITVCLMRNA